MQGADDQRDALIIETGPQTYVINFLFGGDNWKIQQLADSVVSKWGCDTRTMGNIWLGTCNILVLVQFVEQKAFGLFISRDQTAQRDILQAVSKSKEQSHAL